MEDRTKRTGKTASRRALILPYRRVGTFLLGIAIAIIALAAIGATFAVFHAGSQVISNVGTPSATTDLATKGYVDAAAGGISIYASDNTTYVGKLLNAGWAADNDCDMVVYVTTANVVAQFADMDCEEVGSATWYFSSAGCTGVVYLGSGQSGARSTNYNQQTTMGTGYGGRSYFSYRTDAGTCTNASSSFNGYAGTATNRLCGTGACIFR